MPDEVCSFCGRGKKQIGQMIAGGDNNSLRICRVCAKTAWDTLRPNGLVNGPDTMPMPTPADIVAYLDVHIIGQQSAKRALAVSVVNHYKRLFMADTLPDNDPFADVELSKSNVLLIGPTGVGKTAMVQAIANNLHVPLGMGDATTITEAGYVGEDVENLIRKVLLAADGDVELAERGIVYIDEIDKIGVSKGNVSITRDVSGEGVQQGLLKLLEGTVASIPAQGGRKHPEQQYTQVDTTNMLFICGGTFDGLEEIVRRRIGKKKIGFCSENNACDADAERREVMSQVTPEDLHEYGMIPEFIGRLPVVATLDELSVTELQRVLVEPKNALLRQYEKLFHLDNVGLKFTDDARQEIAKRAKAKGTNARGLRSVVEEVMKTPLFDLPTLEKGGQYVVDLDVVTGRTPIKRVLKEVAA